MTGTGPGGPADRGRPAAGPEGGRGAGQGARHDGHARPTAALRAAEPFCHALLHRAAPAEAEDPRAWSSPERSRRSARPSPSSRSATGSSAHSDSGSTARTRSTSCIREPGAAGARSRPGMSFEEAAAVCRRSDHRADVPRQGRPLKGTEHPRLRRVRLDRHRGACSSRSTSAPHVTAVCNTKNVELVRSLGADVVIDYQQEDFTKNGKTYDVIFDAVGKHSFRRCRGLAEAGRDLHRDRLGFAERRAAGAVHTRWIGDKKVRLRDPPRYTKEDVLFLKELIEAGKYRAVIDRHLPARGRRRGDEVRRDAAEDRQRRPDRERG